MDVLEIIACVEEEARRFRALGLLPSELQADDLRKAELLEKAVELLRSLVDDGGRVDERGQVDKGAQVGKMCFSEQRNTFGQSDRENGTGEMAPAPEMTPANDTTGGAFHG